MTWKHVSAASLLACFSLPTAMAADDTEFVDTLWRWTEYLGSDTESSIEISTPGRYTLQLNRDGRYAVRADCNAGGGAYELEGRTLKLGLSAMTLVACPPDSKADRFLQLVMAPGDLLVDGNRLQLTQAGGGRMVFEAQRDVELPGTSWLVRAYNNGQGGVVSILLGSRLSARFSEDGRIQGSAGCNAYFAPYEVSDSRITLGQAGATKKACLDPQGLMAQEAAFLAALPTAHSFQLRGERLQLRTESNALAVDLVSAVTGTLSIGSESELPPEALITIQLQDVSKADAPARVLGEAMIPGKDGSGPIEFEIPFDYTDVDPRFTYSIAARITAGDGSLRFINTQSYPVITRDAPTHDVEVWLESVE